MENEKTFTLTLTDVFVSRRGKGVKGQVQQVKCFGTPVYEKDAPAGSPAIEINIDDIVKQPLGVLVDGVESMSGLSQELIKRGLIDGINDKLRSETAQAKSEYNALVSFIKEQELHKDDEDAEILAKAWQANQASCKRIHAPVLTIEEMAKNRRVGLKSKRKRGFGVVSWSPSLTIRKRSSKLTRSIDFIESTNPED